MSDIVIEVSVPSTTDVEVVADSVDVVADPNGAQVVLVATPGPPGPQGPPGTPGNALGVVMISGIAAMALSGHRAVTARTDGTIEYASNDVPEHLSAPIWITTGAAASAAEVTAVAFGTLEEPTWAWSAGPVFLGADGVLTQTVPTAPAAVFLAQIATATGPTTVFVDRNPSITLA